MVEQLGYDFSKDRLDDIVHSPVTVLDRSDVRITARQEGNSFSVTTFGAIHGAGHRMYEQNLDPKFDFTPLSEDAPVGVHESRSLFGEIIIGSNRAFWQKQYPFFQDRAEGTFDDIALEDFYVSLKKMKTSLTRTDSDSLAYSLHIIIRYETGRMLFNGSLEAADLPGVWNEKYQEYSDVSPENDLEGILRSIHQSGDSFGYFPSCALSYIYTAQLFHAMKRELSIGEISASEDYPDIRKWLTQHTHRYGASRKPNQLIYDATGEELSPGCSVNYMKTIYFDVHQVR